MAFTTTIVEEGQRNYVIQVVGTGADAAVLLVDVSTLNPPCAQVRLLRATYDVSGADVKLSWDATVDVDFDTYSVGSGQTKCYKKVGGIPNRSGAGKTGDVLITSGASSVYSLLLHFAKTDPVLPL